MKLRTRLDLFSSALLSALGATQLLACGGNSAVAGAGSAGFGSVGGESSGGSGSGQSGASSGGSGSGQSGASSGASGQTAGAGGSTSTGANKFPCQNPQDLGNGLIQCKGFQHRAAVVTCASQVPRPEPVPDPGSLAGCKVDADCTDKPFGFCETGSAMGLAITSCHYGCIDDNDCASTQICECSDPVGQCVSANCKSDADCAAGFLCRSYDQSNGCDATAYTCQAPADSCGSDEDCAQGQHCQRDAKTQTFQCSSVSCVSGRPFLVEGAPRLAPRAARADWSELRRLPKPTHSSEMLRARLAEQWTRVALMEHASIAAFARFSLQLLSLGAPASLIESATAAMVDETKHAKACFAVASSYAGTQLGPGRLAVDRSLDESSLTEIVLNTIREGCVGETIAAIEAREAAEHASDPALRELLLEISEDETRHAELAYRFVKWALALGGPELEAAVRCEFEALAAEIPASHRALANDDLDLLRHGIVPEVMREVVRGQAITQVVLPCARALFSTAARMSSYATVSA